MTSTTLRLATYNAHQMYDRVDDPEKDDGPAKSARSLRAVATVLRDSQADVVSLQEVENIEILQELCRHEELGKRYPHRLLVEGNDRKGIDVALLSRYPIARYQSHADEVIGESGGEPQRFRRDLLEADISLPSGETLRVFCNHFIMRAPGWCDRRRLEEAQATLRLLRESMQRVPASYTAVLGDFNDVEGSPVMETFSGGGLHNASAGLPPSWGETRPHGQFGPVRLDHVLVGDALATRLVDSGVQVHPLDAWASDHRLVWADFEVKGRRACHDRERMICSGSGRTGLGEERGHARFSAGVNG